MIESTKQAKITFFDISILILSVYVLLALLIDTFFKLPPEVSHLLEMIDNGICVIFLYDFCFRFYMAESKLQFIKWGWIDLISSIPTCQFLRYGRLIRLLRVLRVLRAFRSVRFITTHLFKSRIQGTFASVVFISILMIIFGSIAILQVECEPSSNIKTAGDALWWAFTTITTVGYGDKYPVTPEGRIIAAFLMVTGVGLFGTFTGYVAAWFMGDKEKEEKKREITAHEEME
jgi:voltage-gated potassium channel